MNDIDKKILREELTFRSSYNRREYLIGKNSIQRKIIVKNLDITADNHCVIKNWKNKEKEGNKNQLQ